MAQVNEILKQMRLDKHLTQTQVAQKLNISQSLYSLIESGQKPGPVEEFMRVVSSMRLRTGRTPGGDFRVGRWKG